MKKNIIRVIIVVSLTLAFAIISAYFTKTDTSWYSKLIKPSIQPEPIVFSIAWGIIYSLFAASFCVVLIKNEGKGTLIYTLNLILLALWCVVFFIRQSIGAGLILMMIILACAVYLTFFAYNKSKLAGALITPYAAWIGYALAINYGVALLN